MDDGRIVELYYERSQSAIDETQKKYGRYCFTVAYNILGSNEDAEECVNDTLLRAWNSIPPSRPQRLGAFLATVTRNLALNRCESRRVRLENDSTVALDELAECLQGCERISVEDEVVLRECINSFLGSLPKKTRVIFMRRYWYMQPLSQIAAETGTKESTVKVILHRTRAKLRDHLREKGVTI